MFIGSQSTIAKICNGVIAQFGRALALHASGYVFKSRCLQLGISFPIQSLRILVLVPCYLSIKLLNQIAIYICRDARRVKDVSLHSFNTSATDALRNPSLQELNF